MLVSQELIQTFAALGDPTRFAILSKLATDGDMTVQEIAQPFAMSLPAVSQHLKVLERAGLISRRREGQRRPCHLRVEGLAEAARWFEHTRQAWQARLDRLERFLASVEILATKRKVTPVASHDPRTTWSPEREIVLCRVIAAPRERVFMAWTDPKQIVQWFGPDGFKVESLECDIRPGGRWRFIYTGPDGTKYDNRMVFLRVEAPRLIEIEHGSDKDDDPARFHVTVTFDEQSDGKCVLTMRQLHPTKEQRDAGIGFGAVELGYQTLGKLAKHVGAN